MDDRRSEVVPWAGAPWTPRDWQARALPAVLASLNTDRRSVVSAVMGSGKSVLIAEVVRQHLGEDAVVITTPTQALVAQLAETLGQRIGPDRVGQYFTRVKHADRQVIVACNPSAPALAEELHKQDRGVGLWIADEVHRTEAKQMLEASQALQPARQLGFTATPFRSDDRERLRLWDSVAFRYSLAEAVQDQVLVPWSVLPWNGQGDDDLDAVCLDLIRKHGHGPGMVNAPDIGDAENFKHYLVSKGIQTGVVHSRKPPEKNRAALAALEAGELNCVVHVNMLAEGVDLPWLRWLCLRRPVSARVRFIQEVGRVLRASPGKERAYLLDPHDLFGAFGWSFEEALGEWNDSKGPPREPVERESIIMRSPAATATDHLSAYCRRLLLPLQAAGWASASRVVATSWRRDMPTAKQLNYLRTCRRWKPWRWLPGEHRQNVARLMARASVLTSGAVSDLIAISQAVSKYRDYPVDADVVDLPPERLIDALHTGPAAGNGDPHWYAAGVWLQDHPRVAFVVFHGGRVIRCWVQDRQPDEDWTALQLVAIRAALHLAASRGQDDVVVVTHSSLAAAIVNQECVPLKPTIQVAARALKGRFQSMSYRADVVSRDDHPAPQYGFRALRKPASQVSVEEV